MNVLMTDTPFNDKEDKCKITQLMFEHFKVQSFSLINTAVLSLFSTGKTCGLVAECGEGITYTVPIFEGYALPHARQYTKVAGQDITHSLMRELTSSGVQLTNEHFNIVR
jgi:actin-related protein